MSNFSETYKWYLWGFGDMTLETAAKLLRDAGCTVEVA